MIEFTVPGDVVPWARARTGNGVHFTPAKQRSYGTTVREVCETAMHGAPPLEGPIELKLLAIYLRPKSAPKRKPPLWKDKKPDADNIVKLVKDALRKLAYRDDAQIASLHVWKRYGEHPGITVKIRPLLDLEEPRQQPRLPDQPALALGAA